MSARGLSRSHGGSGACSLSNETNKLLEELGKSKGLSVRAIQEMKDSVQRQDTGWVDTLSTRTSREVRTPLSQTHALVRAPKVGSARAPTHMPPLPQSFSGKRSQAAIMATNPSAREQFTGGRPGPNREQEKDRLALVMAHGREKAGEMANNVMAAQRQQKARAAATAALAGPTATRGHASGDDNGSADAAREALIDQIIDEIKDRREFLESMKAAGSGQQYEAGVKADISQRMAELSKLGLDTSPGKAQPVPVHARLTLQHR